MWKESANDPALREKFFFRGSDGVYRRENFRAEAWAARYLAGMKTLNPYGTIPSSVRIEDSGWSAALSKGRTALVRFREGAFKGDLGDKAKAVIGYLNENFKGKYNFNRKSAPSALKEVSEADFMEAWLNIHHRAEIRSRGAWGAEYGKGDWRKTGSGSGGGSGGGGDRPPLKTFN
jgi:hypothetical protein